VPKLMVFKDKAGPKCRGAGFRMEVGLRAMIMGIGVIQRRGLSSAHTTLYHG
jgi:hypothetical protein